LDITKKKKYPLNHEPQQSPDSSELITVSIEADEDPNLLRAMPFEKAGLLMSEIWLAKAVLRSTCTKRGKFIYKV
jgi:hypothetical protein